MLSRRPPRWLWCLLRRTERTGEQRLDRLLPALLEEPRPRPRDLRVRDHRRLAGRPALAGPGEPARLGLVEDEERLVAELGELGAPAGAAAHGAVVLDPAHHVDLLAGVDLVPDRLEH